jgi:hypothetical protein
MSPTLPGRSSQLLAGETRVCRLSHRSARHRTCRNPARTNYPNMGGVGFDAGCDGRCQGGSRTRRALPARVDGTRAGFVAYRPESVSKGARGEGGLGRETVAHKGNGDHTRTGSHAHRVEDSPLGTTPVSASLPCCCTRLMCGAQGRRGCTWTAYVQTTVCTSSSRLAISLGSPGSLPRHKEAACCAHRSLQTTIARELLARRCLVKLRIAA